MNRRRDHQRNAEHSWLRNHPRERRRIKRNGLPVCARDRVEVQRICVAVVVGISGVQIGAEFVEMRRDHCESSESILLSSEEADEAILGGLRGSNSYDH